MMADTTEMAMMTVTTTHHTGDYLNVLARLLLLIEKLSLRVF